jgi:anoctamin-10/anoctamin-7
LKSLGFELFVYKNIREETEIIVLIRTPMEKLRAFADNIDFVMKLDSEVIKNLIETGNADLGIAGVEIQHRPDITLLEPFEYIYGKYSRNVSESIYWKEPGMDHPFRDLIRLKLTALILESRMPNGGENLKIRRYIRSGWLKACFPLHNRAKTENLHIEWQKFPFKAQPLDEIKEYFGEKIAMYFTFMEHFTTFLCIPAFVGLPLQIAVFALNDYSGEIREYSALYL